MGTTKCKECGAPMRTLVCTGPGMATDIMICTSCGHRSHRYSEIPRPRIICPECHSLLGRLDTGPKECCCCGTKFKVFKDGKVQIIPVTA